MDGTEGVYVGKHARYRRMVSEVDQEGGRQLGYSGQNLWVWSLSRWNTTPYT